MKDDTISRQAVIDAVESVDWYHQNKNGEMVHGANSDEHQAWYKAEDIYKAIETVPSAQLAQDLTKGCTDTISREAAIDALDVLCQEHRYKIPGKRETYSQYNEAWQDALDRAEGAIGNLPSAQPVVISKLENATECEDAVSRFEVLRLIDYSSNDLNDSVDNWYFQGKVKELPSVTPKQPGWIPSECGENVPEVGDAVLVTFKDSDGKADVYIARWGGNFYDCGYYCLSVSEVLAWMPFPAPWEGGQDGD